MLKSRMLLVTVLFALQFFAAPLLFAEKTRGVVYHILSHELDEMEDMVYAGFLKRVFSKANVEKPVLVIVEINTPGGELVATLKIKKILLSSAIPTICFVNKSALSAGSLIALSCDKTVMARGSEIGAATPVFMGKEGMKKAPEKIVSAARAAWRSAAEANNKNPDIAEAFVDDKILLKKKKHGINKKKGKLLTLTAKEAVKLKIADYIASSISEILEIENITPEKIERKQPSFTYRLLAFFLNPAVAGILIGLGFIGLLFEIKAPGWGVPGTFGILFISLYFISRIFIGLSGWGAPALFAFGALLLLLEIFVIPGFGFAGIAGLFSLLGSILWSYGVDDLQEGMWVLSVAIIFCIIGIFMVMKLLPSLIKKGNHIILSESLSETKKDNPYKSLVNKNGISKTKLRPAGIVEIDGKKVDAISDGEFIDAGTQIRVISFKSDGVIVEIS